jgi:hypothetical protein
VFWEKEGERMLLERLCFGAGSVGREFARARALRPSGRSRDRWVCGSREFCLASRVVGTESSLRFLEGPLRSRIFHRAEV